MTMSTTSLRDSLTLFELKPDTFVSRKQLKEWLPTIEVALFFAKAYELDALKLGELLQITHNSSVLEALQEGNHSTELQDYLVETVSTAFEDVSSVAFENAPPPGEVLPYLWDEALVTVATSIQDVANKLTNTVSRMPSKEGRMLFENMMQLNKRRPTIGQYRAHIQHTPEPKALVILDDSGSVTRETVGAIIGDVVALSWKTNATLALVSSTCRVWQPGGYSADEVMQHVESWGTHYETLKPLLDEDWDTVVCIADYDSSRGAKDVIAQATGRIEQLFDISLVGQPTFLAEVVGQLASKVTPLLLARGLLSW